MTGAPHEKPALILVTGSRRFDDQGLMGEKLTWAWELMRERGLTQVAIVHGGAHGADRQAHAWATQRAGRGVLVHRFPLDEQDWTAPCTPACRPNCRRPRSRGAGTYCRMVGPLRNQRMVEHVLREQPAGGALALIFYPAGGPSPGTRDCHDRIQRACLPYRVYTSRKPVTR